MREFIDTHTHVYPDAIAERTIKLLTAGGERMPEAHTNGTHSALLNEMSKSGVKTSIVLPVVTAPRQFDTINRFASEINGKNGIYSLGGIHPDCEDIPEKLKYIKSLGLCGIKLHPDYQDAFIDDDRYAEIIKNCVELDLTVVVHSGVDLALPDPVHCTPDRIVDLLDKVFGKKYPETTKLVFAHLGANMMYEEAKNSLLGLPIYFDLAYILNKADHDMVVDVIRRHGADKILFATDSPWTSQSEFVELFEQLPLTEEEKELISHKNAKRIFDVR